MLQIFILLSIYIIYLIKYMETIYNNPDKMIMNEDDAMKIMLY
jgi:uncharacterized ion transporter superfamily protein YfcC